MIRWLKRGIAEYRFKRAVDNMMAHGESHCGRSTGPCPFYEGLSQIMSAAHDHLLRVTS